MRTEFLTGQGQPALVSARGQEDMLRRVRAEVTAIATRAGDSRRQLRRGQTRTGPAGLLEIENSCLDALAALDTVEPRPARLRASIPWKRQAHATVNGRPTAAPYGRQDQRAGQIREDALKLVSDMSDAGFGRTRTTAGVLSEMIGVSNRLAQIEQAVPARRAA
jgi:hypothetical protein